MRKILPLLLIGIILCGYDFEITEYSYDWMGETYQLEALGPPLTSEKVNCITTDVHSFLESIGWGNREIVYFSVRNWGFCWEGSCNTWLSVTFEKIE